MSDAVQPTRRRRSKQPEGKQRLPAKKPLGHEVQGETRLRALPRTQPLRALGVIDEVFGWQAPKDPLREALALLNSRRGEWIHDSARGNEGILQPRRM